MKQKSFLKISLLLFALLGFTKQSFSQTVAFTYTGGQQTYTVPTGVFTLSVDAIGGGGGYPYWQCGNAVQYAAAGRVQCKLNVTPGQVLYLYVGGKGGSEACNSCTAQTGGFNGGVNGGSCAGASGGASDIRLAAGTISGLNVTPYTSTNRLVVAGGGGGGADYYGFGGSGGGLVGGTGIVNSIYGGVGGTGGTQTSGGTNGNSGSLGVGGSRISYGTGGGGYWGGASGTGTSGGGGGGSSYTDPTLCSSVIHTQGYAPAVGNGLISLLPIPTPVASLNFDGTNDYVEANNQFVVGTSDFTLEAWVYPTSTSGSQMIIAQDVSGDGFNQFRLLLNSGGNSALSFFFGNASATGVGFSSASNVPVNTWTHVAVVRSGVNHYMYLNGVLTNSVTFTSVINNLSGTTTNKPLRIGARGNSSGPTDLFKGAIDEVRIWNVARTGSQISASMNCDVAQNANLQYYYRFDDGAAGGTNTSISGTSDYSGHGNCGQLHNFALTGSTSNFITSAISSCNSITITPPAAITGTLNVYTGATTTLSDSVTGGTWISTNTAVATIGTSGIVTGIGAGTSVISYTIGCNAVTAVVTVIAPRSGINFDGVNDSISTNNFITNLSFGDFTLECWVKTTGTSEGLITKTYGGSYNWGQRSFYIDAAGKPAMVGFATNYILSDMAVNDGQWHHIACTWILSSLTGRIYVDGVNHTGAVTYYPYSSETGSIVIGGANFGSEAPNVFSGSMDEVRIWDVAHTQSEVIATMNCSVPQQTHLKAYYRFDEGTAAGDNTVITNALDYSGNNICGRLNNFGLTGTTSNYVSGSIGDCSSIAASVPGAITGNTTISTAITTSLADAVAGGTWSSSNTSVATIGTSGKVTGLSVGTSIISYTIGCNAATAIITVNAPRSGLNFDGSNDYISTNVSVVDLAYGAFTLETWVKTTGVSMGLFTKQDAGTSWDYGEKCFYLDAAGKPTYVGYACGYINSSMAVNDGNWHHIALTWSYTGLSAHIYVDGIERTSTIGFYPAYADYGTFNIGNGNYNGYTPEAPNTFSGTMDEIRVWNVARTQSQIQSAMNCSVPQQTGLVAYYRFDEGTAGGSNSTITNAVDYSGNNICGQLNNFSLTGTSSNYVSGSIGDCSPISMGAPAAITGNTTLSTAITTTLADATPGGIWSSSNTAVATIGTTGKVTGLAVGTSLISYTIGCNAATTAVTVNAPRSGINFDGVNDSISTNNFITNLSFGDFTLECWVKTTGTSEGLITKTYGGSYNWGQRSFYIDATGKPAMVGFATNFILSDMAVNDGQWHHIACTWILSGLVGRIYIDGVNHTGVVTYYPYSSETGSIVIGGANFGSEAPNVFSGSMDEVRIWDVARTQSQVQSSMNCTIPAQTHLKAYYRFDEGVAVGTNTGLVNANDYSGNNYCGHLNNFALTGSTSNFVSGTIGDCSPIAISSVGPISGTTTICPSGTTTLTDTAAGGAWLSGNTSVATITSSGVVTGIAPGTAIITYSLNCSSSTVVITVNPAVSAITGETSVCVGSSTTLFNSTSGGTWSISNANATIGSSTGVVNGVTTGASIATYTTPSGCGTSTAININPVPSSSFSVTPNPVCLGTATTFTGASASGNCIGKALSFNGTTGVASLGSVISSATSDITLEAWVNWDGTGSGIQMMMVNGNTAFNGYALMSVRDTVYGILGNVTFMKSGALLTPHVWTHLALVCNASHVWTMYQNGVATTLTNNTLTPNNPSGSGGQFYIGADPLHTGEAFHGNVDEAKFWTVARSQSQVQNDMTLCSESAQSNLIGYYPFNEGSGTSTADASGNGHSLTITSPIWINDTLNNNITSLSFGDGASSISAGVVHTYTTIGTYMPTYTVTSRGCSSTTTKTVTVNPIPGAIGGAATVCVGSTTTLTNTAPVGIWSSTNTAAATVGSTGVVTGVAAGTTIISYVTGCGTVTKVIRSIPLPAAITGSSSMCISSTTTLSNSAAGGTWSSSATGIATIGSLTGIVSSIANGTTIVTYSTGCGSPATFVETVISSPAPITGTTTFCPGTTNTLSNTTAGGVWSSSNTSIATVGAGTGVVTGVAAGTAIISYAIPCGVATIVVSVATGLTPIIGSPSVCQGLTTTLANATAGGTWSSTATSVAIIGSTTGVVSGITAGTTIISYVTPTGCFAVATFTVNARAAITGPTSICAGTTVNLFNPNTGGLWTSSNIAVATVNCNLGIIKGLTSGTSIISYTLPTGCSSTYTVTVISLTASTGASTLCTGASTTMSNSTPGGVWTSSDTTLATVNSSTGVVTGLNPGNVVINYAVGNGCNVSSGITILMLTSNTGGSNVCQGLTTTISNVTVGGTWSSNNTAVATVVASTGVITGVATGAAVVTYTFGASCVTTTSVNVNAVPASVTVSGGGTSCGSATLTATGGGGGTIYFQGTNPNGTSTSTASSSQVVTASGTYYFRSLSSAGCWGGAGSATVLVPTITGASTVCLGTTSTLANSGGSATWSSSNTSVATIGSATGIITPVAAGSSIITSTLSSGCVVTTTITVGTPGSMSGAHTVCVGQTTTLLNPGIGGTWSSSAPTVASVGTSGVVTGVAAGLAATISYAYSATCRATWTVTVNALSAIVSPGISCLGQTVTCTDGVAGGIWSSSDPTVATINATGVVTGVATGATTISYVLPSGCTTTTPMSIKVLSAITGPSTVCAGQSITLSNSTCGGTWSTTSPTIATVNSGNGIVVGVAGISVTLSAPITYTLGSGCKAVTNVTVNPLPAIGGTTNVCQGLTTTLTETTPGGSWVSATTSIATIGTNGVLNGVGSGIVTISYVLPTGCTTTTPVYVNPVAPISGPSTVCLGQSITLTNPAGAGTWSSGAVTIATVGSNNGIVRGIAAGLSAPITYTFCTGCRSIATVSVAPIGAIAGPVSVCQGQMVTLTDASAGGSWNSSNSSMAAFNSTNGNVTGVNPGLVTISYIMPVTGCTSTASLTVNPSAAINGPTNVCVAQTITLSNVVSGGLWSSSSVTTAKVGSSNGVVTGMAGGIAATISYTTAQGCKTIKSVSVVALPMPATIAGPATVSVSGAPITLTNSVTGGVWSSSNTAKATVVAATGVVTGVSVGSTIITYTVTNSGGCTNFVTKNIIVGPAAAPHSANPDQSLTIIEGTSIQLTETTQGGAWYNADGEGIITINNEIGNVTGIAPGKATVSYTVVTGSTTTLSITEITVKAKPAIINTVNTESISVKILPNPNHGDFIIKGTTGITEASVVTLEVTDMLGQVVYSNQLTLADGIINERVILSNTLANGTYLLNLRTANTQNVFHFVIEK